MADDDDNVRGSKDNTGREHKPKHAKNRDKAPEGHLGTWRISAPGLGGGGTANKRQVSKAGEQTREPEPQKYIDPAKDTRPAFHETDDKATNDFYKKSHRMIPKDAPERGTSFEGPRLSQSDFAKAFRQAQGRTKAMQKSKGIDPG